MAFDLAAFNASLGSMFGHQQPQQAQATPAQNYLGAMYGTNYGGKLPTQSVSNAPTYSTAGLADIFSGNSAGVSAMDPNLRNRMTAANQGNITQGIPAFLGAGWTPNNNVGTGADMTNQQDFSAIHDLGKELGFTGTGQYQDLTQDQNATSELYRNMGVDMSGYQGQSAKMRDLQDYTKNYYGISGLGGNPSSDPRGATRALYRDNGQGQLEAVTRPVNYHAAESGGFWQKDVGKELITALSMMAPAFGGVAGALGSGTTNTLSAGSGLGLTTPVSNAIGTGATNALVNAGVSGLAAGDPRAALTSLVGAGAGAAANSVLGNAGGLGQMFSSAGAGQSALNPMAYYRQALGAAGLGGSPLGQGMQLAGYGRTLGNLFNAGGA